MTTDVHPPRPPAPRRGPVRRLLEVRGLVGGHTAPHVQTRLRSSDGVLLTGSYLPGAGAEQGPAVLLAHGFAAHRRKPAYARLADGLAARLPVLALDLRGHGDSGGWSTFGDREALDIEAGVEWLRAMGHREVVGLGLSMGATAALHAAARGTRFDGLVLISAPARFRAVPETDPTRRLKRLWDSPGHRRVLWLVTGVRLAGPEQWRRPDHPVEMAGGVSAPLLVVHGRDDGYFPVDDARALMAAAAGPCTLWLEPAGFGHAEDGLTPPFIDDLRAAVVHASECGAFPDREVSEEA